jgi:hypothetical protein
MYENLNGILYRSFVSPDYCKKIRDIGISDQTNYRWKIDAGEIALTTAVFDIDDYYAVTRKLVDQRLVRDQNLPAYQVTDIEQAFPEDYILAKLNSRYRIDFPLYNVISEKLKEGFERMPDAYAEALLLLIDSNVVKVEVLNRLLVSSS